jgi:hypothetical protein
MGATTVAVNLAVGLAQRGMPTVLWDCADDRAATRWLHLRGGVAGLEVRGGEEWEAKAAGGPAASLHVFDAPWPWLQERPTLGAELWVVVALQETPRVLDQVKVMAAGGHPSGMPPLALLIPNQVRLEDWATAEPLLTALAGAVGEERVATPVPT